MAPCVNARSPATSTTLIVTGLFGNAGTCALAPVAAQAIVSTPKQKCVTRRATILHDFRTTLACASAGSVLKAAPSQSDGSIVTINRHSRACGNPFSFSDKTWIPAFAGMTHLFPIVGRNATYSWTNASFSLRRADLLVPDL